MTAVRVIAFFKVIATHHVDTHAKTYDLSCEHMLRKKTHTQQAYQANTQNNKRYCDKQRAHQCHRNDYVMSCDIDDMPCNCAARRKIELLEVGQ